MHGDYVCIIVSTYILRRYHRTTDLLDLESETVWVGLVLAVLDCWGW